MMGKHRNQWKRSQHGKSTRANLKEKRKKENICLNKSSMRQSPKKEIMTIIPMKKCNSN